MVRQNCCMIVILGVDPMIEMLGSLSRSVLRGLRRPVNPKERSVRSMIAACRGASWRHARSLWCALPFAPLGWHRQSHGEGVYAPSLFWSGKAGLVMTDASNASWQKARPCRCRGLYDGSGWRWRREPSQSRQSTTAPSTTFQRISPAAFPRATGGAPSASQARHRQAPSFLGSGMAQPGAQKMRPGRHRQRMVRFGASCCVLCGRATSAYLLKYRGRVHEADRARRTCSYAALAGCGPRRTCVVFNLLDSVCPCRYTTALGTVPSFPQFILCKLHLVHDSPSLKKGLFTEHEHICEHPL